MFYSNNVGAMALKSECLVWAKHMIDSKVKLRNDEASNQTVIRWERPRRGWVKLNVDGLCRLKGRKQLLVD